MDQQVDVLIVGGGLVGLSLACALTSSRLSITVIDAGGAPEAVTGAAAERQDYSLRSGFEARVSAINPASREFLSRIDAWPAERICAFSRMSVWDGRGTAHIEFDADSISEPALGYIVENRNLLSSLRSAASGVDLRFDTEISAIESGPEGYRVQLADGEWLACRLLVGADGGNSLVRERCGIRTVGWRYGQDALVTNVMTSLLHGHTARQCFTAIGPLAFLPLETPDENLCSIVWSTDRTDELLALDEGELCRRLTLAFEGALGEVIGVDKRYSFPLRQQHALSYVRPHLALIGDAAHVIHPLAGQGVNLGFGDARALAIELAECRFSGQSPGDVSLLRRYQRSRRPFNVMVSSAMEGFRRLYGGDRPAVNWVRNTGMRIVNDSGLVKSVVMKLACGR